MTEGLASLLSSGFILYVFSNWDLCAGFEVMQVSAVSEPVPIKTDFLFPGSPGAFNDVIVIVHYLTPEMMA